MLISFKLDDVRKKIHNYFFVLSYLQFYYYKKQSGTKEDAFCLQEFVKTNKLSSNF